MTDLKKGIIEINGFEINAKTTVNDIINNLIDFCAFKIVSEDASDAFFRFENVKLIDRTFKAKMYFYRSRLSHIELFSACGGKPSFEELFEEDCAWLRNVLGEPTKAGSNGVVFVFDAVQVGATLRECDGRTGPDEYIGVQY